MIKVNFENDALKFNLKIQMKNPILKAIAFSLREAKFYRFVNFFVHE